MIDILSLLSLTLHLCICVLAGFSCCCVSEFSCLKVVLKICKNNLLQSSRVPTNLKGSCLKIPLKRSRSCWRFVKGWGDCNSLKLKRQFGDVPWMLGLTIPCLFISEKNRWIKMWKRLSEWEVEIRRAKTNSQRKSQSCKSWSSKVMRMSRSCKPGFILLHNMKGLQSSRIGLPC